MKKYLISIILICSTSILFSSELRSPEWPAIRKVHLLKEPACPLCGMVRKDINVHHMYPYTHIEARKGKVAFIVFQTKANESEIHLLNTLTLIAI